MRNVWYGEGNEVRIFMYRKGVEFTAWIDISDLETVDNVSTTWYPHPATAPEGKFYVVGKVWDAAAGRSRTTMLHRVIMGVTDPLVEVHHRDNDGLNNRRSNLWTMMHRENLRERFPGRDWAAFDAKRRYDQLYRTERRIANGLAAKYGVTRQYLWMIRMGRVIDAGRGKLILEEYTALIK